MRILRSIVAPPTTHMSSCETKFTGCSSIRFEIVRDELVWDKAILLQKLAHEFQRRTLVPPALDGHIKHFALAIHGAPKIDHSDEVRLTRVDAEHRLGSCWIFGIAGF